MLGGLGGASAWHLHGGGKGSAVKAVLPDLRGDLVPWRKVQLSWGEWQQATGHDFLSPTA